MIQQVQAEFLMAGLATIKAPTCCRHAALDQATASFKGISGYLNDPKLRYGFATTADLQRNLEAVSGQSLGYFSNNGMPARATRLYGWYNGRKQKTESCCNA